MGHQPQRDTDVIVKPPLGGVHVEVGQHWAVLHGGGYDTIEVAEVLEGRYLRPPDVALIATEFCRVRWLTGRLQGQVTDQRAPGHILGRDGHHALLRRADGSLTPWGQAEHERAERRRPCPTCGRSG